MRTQFFMITILFLIALMGTASTDEQAVYSTHLAWKAAFEQADIDAINNIWSHAADTTLIPLGGEKKNGWQKIQAELTLSFQLTGETQVSESNLLITLSGDTASATSNYRWSPIPFLPLFAVERYRKENNVWKMHAQDGTGKVLPPLRPDDETRVRERVEQAHDALAAADLNKLKALTADQNFTYIAFDGTVHQEFDEAVISDDLEKIQMLRLEVIYLIDDTATAHMRLTLIGNRMRKIELVQKNFQLTKIDFAPEPLAAEPKGKLTTTWAQLKTRKR